MIARRRKRILFALVSLCAGCGMSPEEARRELGALGLPYTAEALFGAIRAGDPYAVDLFLTAGMSLDVVDSDGVPVLLAVFDSESQVGGNPSDRLRILESLLANGADPDQHDGDNVTAVCAALQVEESLTDIIAQADSLEPEATAAIRQLEAVVRSIKEATRRPHRSTQCALANHFSDDFERLIDLPGFDPLEPVPYRPEADGRASFVDIPAFTIAVLHATDTVVVARLVELGADVHMTDNRGNSSLMHAVSRRGSSDEMVGFLLSRGVDPTLANSDGETALTFAIRRSQNLELVNLLLDRGVDATQAGEGGNTALHYLMNYFFPNLEIVRLLVNAGADPEARNVPGLTALDLMARNVPRLRQPEVRNALLGR